MAKQVKRDRIRICLDCKWMKHSRDDFERGKCMYYDHEIGYVNSHDWCKHWGRVTYGYDAEDEYDNDEYDSLEI